MRVETADEHQWNKTVKDEIYSLCPGIIVAEWDLFNSEERGTDSLFQGQ